MKYEYKELLTTALYGVALGVFASAIGIALWQLGALIGILAIARAVYPVRYH